MQGVIPGICTSAQKLFLVAFQKFIFRFDEGFKVLEILLPLRTVAA